MEPYVFTSSSTVTASTVPLTASPGIDIFSLIISFFSGEAGASLLSFRGVLSIVDIIWTIFAFLAFIVSGIMLALYAYASTRRWQYYQLGTQELRDAEDLYDEMYRGVKKNDRMKDIFIHLDSLNPNDWKLAIIEADIILDDILKQHGYVGNSLGERLKSISPQQFGSLQDAWEAHKVRNRIAHDGADFVLTKRLAEETINRYRRVFAEFGV
jgi:hypothetical protein